jgi:hypothetical protein
VNCKVCPAHRDRYGRTTEAFTLLMSIGIPLENTKRPEPHTVVGVGLRPYERSRCVEHEGSYSKCLGKGVPAPPGMGMIAPQTLLRNASMAQI